MKVLYRLVCFFSDRGIPRNTPPTAAADGELMLKDLMIFKNCGTSSQYRYSGSLQQCTLKVDAQQSAMKNILTTPVDLKWTMVNQCVSGTSEVCVGHAINKSYKKVRKLDSFILNLYSVVKRRISQGHDVSGCSSLMMLLTIFWGPCKKKKKKDELLL